MCCGPENSRAWRLEKVDTALPPLCFSPSVVCPKCTFLSRNTVLNTHRFFFYHKLLQAPKFCDLVGIVPTEPRKRRGVPRHLPCTPPPNGHHLYLNRSVFAERSHVWQKPVVRRASQSHPILQAHVTLPPARAPFLEQDGVWPGNAVQFQALRCLEASASAPLGSSHHGKKFSVATGGRGHLVRVIGRCQIRKGLEEASSAASCPGHPCGGIRHTSDTVWTLQPQWNRTSPDRTIMSKRVIGFCL